MINSGIYRYDNRPHEELKHMRSFPKHFHDGSDEKISESRFSEDPKDVLREFFRSLGQKFIKKGIHLLSSPSKNFRARY